MCSERRVYPDVIARETTAKLLNKLPNPFATASWRFAACPQPAHCSHHTDVIVLRQAVSCRGRSFTYSKVLAPSVPPFPATLQNQKKIQKECATTWKQC